VFLRKLPNAHKAKGVDPLIGEMEKYIRDEYKNGEACGSRGGSNII